MTEKKDKTTEVTQAQIQACHDWDAEFGRELAERAAKLPWPDPTCDMDLDEEPQ